MSGRDYYSTVSQALNIDALFLVFGCKLFPSLLRVFRIFLVLSQCDEISLEST